jgi:TonB family protein
VSLRAINRWLAVGLFLAMTATWIVKPSPASGQQQEGEITRKVKSKVSPTYPDIAKRMNISGIVKLIVIVAPNGSVKSTKVLGGHPLLVSAAEDAVKKWKFESGPEESSGVVEFSFKGEN